MSGDDAITLGLFTAQVEELAKKAERTRLIKLARYLANETVHGLHAIQLLGFIDMLEQRLAEE